MEKDIYRGRSEFDMIDGKCARVGKKDDALRSRGKFRVLSRLND
jgi:hypothetical protein